MGRSELDRFWDSMDTQLMVMAAHRYCLGRQSYIVGACIDWILRHRSRLERNTLRIIVRDTVEALVSGRAGSELIDAPGWKRLAQLLFDEMNDEDQSWVKRFGYGDAEFPLRTTEVFPS